MKKRNKKVLLTIIMVAISINFIGCKDDEDFQVWVSEGSHFKVTMKVYEEENTIYTTVQYNDTINPTFFGDKVWWNCKNTSDSTIMITAFQNNGIDSFCNNGFSIPFEIRKISDDKQEWMYLGLHTLNNLGVPYDYIFERKR